MNELDIWKLKGWLSGLDEWFAGPPRRTKMFTTALHDVSGIVELSWSRRSNTIEGRYLIDHPEFNRIAWGDPKVGCILILFSGCADKPYRQVSAYPGEPSTWDRMKDAVAREAPTVFGALSSLRALYEEFVAEEPQFEDTVPHWRAKALREIHAAVLAWLLDQEWRPHVERALREQKFPNDLFEQVPARLEQLQRQKERKTI